MTTRLATPAAASGAMRRRAILLMGPTGAGKSEIAIRLAQ